MELNWKLLKALLNAMGVPGQESSVHRLIEKNVTVKTHSFVRTPLGGLIAKENSNKKKRIAICSHSDEVGFIVTRLNPDGKIEVIPLGGLVTPLVFASRLAFETIKGKTVLGAFVGPSMQDLSIISGPPRRRGFRISGAMINAAINSPTNKVDLGFNSKEELEKAGIAIGCQGTFLNDAKLIGNNKVLSKAIDNRVGTYLNLSSLNSGLTNKDFAIDHIFGVREEIGARAITTLLNEEDYDLAIVLDTSPSREADNMGILGKGPLHRIMDALHIANPVLLEFTRKVAKEHKIPLQDYISHGGTDAGSISKMKAGIPVLQVTMAVKNIHTGNSMCDIDDITKTQELLNNIARQISSKVRSKSIK